MAHTSWRASTRLLRGSRGRRALTARAGLTLLLALGGCAPGALASEDGGARAVPDGSRSDDAGRRADAGADGGSPPDHADAGGSPADGGPPAAPCAELIAPLRLGRLVDHEASIESGGTGVPFGESHNWIPQATSNVFDGDVLRAVELHVYRFVAPPAGRRGTLSTPSTQAGSTFGLAARCGDFDVPPGCLAGASGAIVWTTRDDPASFECALEPGATYYLSVGWFDLPTYLSEHRVHASNCRCPSELVCDPATQRATCSARHNSTAHP